ncbi:MAG: hypothetical protein CFE21_03680 [Bacteroidetes bacterium B1(2017)]|nr:MAG: hypothetical protein CFE21_03680 [Bacteroidetes bacterium B1(2017)]
MGLNTNHTVEELAGQRCAIVEKNISLERANFLTGILSGNGYRVVCVEAAPAKPAKAAAAPAEGEEAGATATATVTAEPTAATLFTLGVTDVLFNPINAVYGRLLRSSQGTKVTAAYWNQESTVSNDELPYFKK